MNHVHFCHDFRTEFPQHARSMKFISAVSLLLCTVFASTAEAAPRSGECEYRKTARGKRTSVKLCTVTGNYAELSIRVTQGVPVLVKLAPDQLSSSVRPDPNTLSFGEQDGLLVYEPLVRTFTRPIVAQLSTKSGVDITLRFVMSENPDTQVHILRPDQAERDAACERKMDTLRSELAAEFQSKEASLARRTKNEGRKWVLSSILNRFSSDAMKQIAFDDFLRIRARERIRMDDVVILKLEIDERKGQQVSLTRPRAFLVNGGARVPTTSDAVCSKLDLGPGDSTFCAVAVKLPSSTPDTARIDVVLEDSRSIRSVTLEGVDIR